MLHMMILVHLFLQFVSLEMPSVLWLHSLHITLCRSTASPSREPVKQLVSLTGPQFDMDKVRSFMFDGGKDIPDAAKQLFEAMEIKQKV